MNRNILLSSLFIVGTGFVVASLTFKWLALLVVACLIGLCGFAMWRVFRPSEEAEDETSNMVSIVGLFSQLPYLDDKVLAEYASQAWDIEFEIGDDAQTFVAGSSPLFVIKTADRIYSVNYFNRPYFDNVDEIIEELTEVRTTHVIETHQSWLSVDLLTDSRSLDLSHEYARIGWLLNRILNGDCLGILVPQIMRLVPWDGSVEDALLSEDPLAALAPVNPPVVPIEDSDPKLKAAVKQALSEWPRFIHAFETHMRDEEREEGRNFSVKAPISSDGNTEFIWVTVTSIENGIVYGKLGNEPVSLNGLCEGDRVRVRESDVNDWVYTDGSDVVGGFSIKVITEWANRFKSSR